MGWGVFIAYALIAAASIATYFLVKPSQNLEAQDMSPNSIDAFNVTLAQEGTVVRMIFGIVRINTNLLWYGSLTNVGIYEEIDTDSGDKWILKGYTYYMSMHHALGIGVINIKRIYRDDRRMSVSGLPSNPYNYCGGSWISPTVSLSGSNMPTQYIYHNPGCGSAKPSYGGNSPAMNPVSHVWMPSAWMGENVSNAPTFHMVVEKFFPGSHPLSFPRHSTYGSNPASIIYEVLLASGETASTIDTTTFEEAAQAFDHRNYYLSLTIENQAEWREHLKKIVGNYIDATVRKNWSTGKYELIAHDQYVDVDYGFTEQDFVEFSFTRPGWDETYNDLRANYVDRSKHYTRRTLRAYNSASIQMLGYARQKTIDLTAFNDKGIASKRLWELLKRFSYPTAIVKFKTGLWGARLPGPGQLVGVIHNEYNLTGQAYRVLDKRISEEDQNYIDWICEEDINNTFTLSYQDGADPEWENPDYDANPLVYQGYFEMPNCNLITANTKTFICLAARVGQEIGFDVQYSSDGSSYESKRIVNEWAMYGTLDIAYDDETEEVDDDVGILFTPYNEDYAPTFDNLSRTQLYDYNRVAIIGNELMLFQTMTAEGESSYRLTGVVRGFLNTPIEQHSSSSPIWLVRIDSDVLVTVNQTSFYFKYLPQAIGGEFVDIGDATPMSITATGIAAKPYPPYSIKATRTGDEVVFEWNPVVKYIDGAGTKTPDENSDPAVLYEGDFYFDASVGSHDQYVDGTTLTITQSGAFTVTLKNRVNSILSDGATISVGADDGEYIGPEITYV